MAAVPHFDVPFRYAGSFAVNEQGSEEDIAACVYAVCASEPGQFFDLPDFGFPDLFGTQEPLSPERILATIQSQEPRASLLVQVNPVAYEQSVVNANIQVG